MNSRSLQVQFPEVYREFFSRCPIVVSTPGDFFWVGEYSVLFGGLAIKQNLPLRVYVGLEPQKLPGFKMGESSAFITSSSRFEPWIIPNDIKNKLIGFLNEELSTSLQIRLDCKINILCEIPRGCGLTSGPAFCVALTTAVFLASNLISSAAIARWNQLPVCQLSTDKDFDKVFRTAWKADFIFRSSFASGAPCFLPLAHSAYPVVYFIEKQTVAAVPDLSVIDQRKYFGFRIDELINLGREKPIDLGTLRDWPVDFGLIFSEDARHSDTTIRSIKGVEEYLSGFALWWRKILSKLEPPKDKFLFSRIVKDPQLEVGGSYLDALVTTGLEMLYSFSRILSQGSSKEAIRDFLRIINCTHKLVTPLYTPSLVADEICFWIDKYIRDSGDDCGAGCRLVVEGCGDILFVESPHVLRNQISDLIADLQNKTKKNIQLHYTSWIDGFEEEGVKIEQHLAEGIYSEFVSEGSISLKSFSREGVPQLGLYSLEDFEKTKPDIDLLLDAVGNNIYIRGKKLTSEEIPSSRATIGILAILLENLGKNISNSQLPESSYARDRNEIQSKIVSPLVRLFKTETQKVLPLKISGGLVEFKIKLEPSDLDIRILDKGF